MVARLDEGYRLESYCVYLNEKHIASRNRASFNKFTGSSPVLATKSYQRR
jgi:hypothetical protein